MQCTSSPSSWPKLVLSQALFSGTCCLSVYGSSKLLQIITKVEMESLASKPILDPYKTIGCFASGPTSASKSAPFSLAACCNNSFKIYSVELAIKLVSPVFGGPIRAIHTYNEFTYILVGTELLKIRYHHVVRKWDLGTPVSAAKGKGREPASMLVFQGLIILALGQTVYLVPQAKNNSREREEQQFIESMNLGINIIQIVHPVTYINKIIAYSSDSIALVNPVSQKTLFNYSTLTSQFSSSQRRITRIYPTPLIDIAAVCLDSGEIVIVNLRTSKMVFTMKQKRMVTALAFSQSDSMMATGDEIGNILLWDLQNKKIVYRLEGAFSNGVDFLCFVPGMPLLTGTSGKANSVRQFRINFDDSKTLLQFRDRTGCPSADPIIKFRCQNDKQITFSTKNSTVFSSIYSHSNMYTLPHCLDSSLPYHIVGKNFNIQLYRERTIIGKLSINQNAQVCKFSISKKFVIVGTKTKIIKVAIPGGSSPSTLLHVSCEWKVNDPSEIVLHNEHFIYILCYDAIHVLDFNQSLIVATVNEGNICYNLVSNLSESMLALENRTKQCVEIWDMRTIRMCRQFPKLKNKSNCSKICFTSDNRYLLTAQVDHTLSIWSILQSNLYKVLKLEGKIIEMGFTPDNCYFMSVFEGGKEINIWNSYIGKITSSQEESSLCKFHTTLNYLTQDYREKLNIRTNQSQQQSVRPDNQTALDTLLDSIEDANDLRGHQYNFTHVSKWMPLVYYDQIKNRNSILGKGEEAPVLPFFLDFKNISQEQAKLNNQMKQQVRDKRSKQKERVDSQLSNDLHQIRLDSKSTGRGYEKTWEMLSSLSLAQIDYQLRRFLIMPGNLGHLIKTLSHILSASSASYNRMQLNVVLMRVLDIAGSEVCSQEIKEIGDQLLGKVRKTLELEEDVVLRCAAISSQTV